ncbi:serpin B5-like [Sabethes cyaneus]|uniref:serpin B5-like n=1 Tax=Sabethes cyaneus TaxID=53552 RepID=UPI00237DE53D|nr:serpin B5-like [Sabethes cyaneus]
MLGKTFFLVLSVCSLSGFAASEPQSAAKRVHFPERAPQAVFSWNFYKESLDLSRNVACSPFTIRMLFAALEHISPRASSSIRTRYDQQLKQALNVLNANIMSGRYRKLIPKLKQDSAIKIESLIAALGEGEFAGVVKRIAERYQLSFGRFGKKNKDCMARSINRAMGNLTDGRMSNYLTKSDLDFAKQLLLLNQLEFKGIWRKRFDAEWIVTCPFYLNSERSLPVEFLFLEDYLPYYHNSTEDISAVELAFEKKSLFSCLLIKPIAGGLEQLIPKLNHRVFREIYNNLRRGSKVTVRVPKFAINSKINARSVLIKMGLSLPFSDDTYRLYDGNGRVPLDDVIQRTSFTFGEQGEEDAPQILDRVMPDTFSAHQPFVFVVFERATGVPIVMGHYVQPEQSEVSSSEVNPMRCDNPPRGF